VSGALDPDPIVVDVGHETRPRPGVDAIDAIDV